VGEWLIFARDKIKTGVMLSV